MIGEPIASAPLSTPFSPYVPIAARLYAAATLSAKASARIIAAPLALAGRGQISASAFRVKFTAASLVGTASLVGQALFKIYAATKEFITRPTDALANQPFFGTVQKALRFDRSIVNGRGIGEVTAGWGELELINAEGDYDSLIDRYAIDGRRVVVKVGADGAAYNSFRTLFDGSATDWAVEEDVLRVSLRDNGYKLEVPAQPNLYGGTGGTDGGDDLKGRRKPRAFGRLLNVTPAFEIPAELLFRVNDGPVSAIGPVYDRGVALTFAADYPSTGALRAATSGAPGSGAALVPGHYATCLAEGTFRLGGSPAGTVTCDLRGDAVGGYVETTADIVARLLSGTVKLAEVEISTPTFEALNVEQPAPVGYWIDPGSDETVAEIVGKLMAGVGGWGGFRRNGRYEVSRFTAPAGIPSGSYDRRDIVEIAREKLPGDLSPTPWRFRVGWARNWTVQSDVDGQFGMTAERIAFLRQELRLAEASSARIRADRPLGKDIEPVQAFFHEEAPALAEAQRLLELYGMASALYRFTVKSQAFIHDIGDVIAVTYPRWDLRAGRLLRIVVVSEDTDANSVEITGFG